MERTLPEAVEILRRWDVVWVRSADKVREPLKSGSKREVFRVYSSAMVEVEKQAQRHLRCLIAGIDPRTRKTLSDARVLSDPEILRSLAFALDALRSRRARKAAATSSAAESSAESREAGVWTAKEEQDLLAHFRARRGLDEIAAHHGRPADAILARLVHLGVVASQQEAQVIFRRQQQRLRAPV